MGAWSLGGSETREPMSMVLNTRLGWGQEGSMTQQHPRCARRPEVEDRELMSIQELKMLMMQMTETQRMWGASARRQHSPGLAPRRSGDRGFLLSELGKAWLCVSLWSAFWRERPE